MTQATADPALAPRPAPRPRGGLSPSALGALFGLTLRQQLHGRRVLVLAGLFLVPLGLAVLALHQGATGPEVEFVVIFNLIPHAFAPVAALLYASGMIQDEVEEQTLTYLLVRALPKWALYLTKLLATLLLTVALTVVLTAPTLAVIYLGSAETWGGSLAVRALLTLGLLALALVAYCSLFGCLSLFARRSLVVGIAYILIFEGLLANIDFAVRRLTVMYYFRVLADRRLNLPAEAVEGWSLDLPNDPSAGRCVAVLLAASVALTALAAWTFSTREFRVKTPEGS